eukprot:g58016.t1
MYFISILAGLKDVILTSRLVLRHIHVFDQHPSCFFLGCVLFGLDITFNIYSSDLDCSSRNRCLCKGGGSSLAECPKGFYCNAGAKQSCGDMSVYCPPQSLQPTVVPPGFYSTGQGAGAVFQKTGTCAQPAKTAAECNEWAMLLGLENVNSTYSGEREANNKRSRRSCNKSLLDTC